MTEEMHPAQNPAPATPTPTPTTPAKPLVPPLECTARDSRFAVLLLALCLFAANCTMLCRTGAGYA